MDGPGANSYPIAAYTYVLVNQSWVDCDTSTRVLTFLDWCLNAPGPRARAQSFDLVPLPESTIMLVENQLRTLTCSDKKFPALPCTFFLRFLSACMLLIDFNYSNCDWM